MAVSKWRSPAPSVSPAATAAASVASRPSPAPGPELRRTCRRLPVTKYPTARAFTVCSIFRGASTIYHSTLVYYLYHLSAGSFACLDGWAKGLFNFATPAMIEGTIRFDPFMMIPGVAHP